MHEYDLTQVSGRGAVEWAQACKRVDDKNARFVKQLRFLNFKAAHPNDGWVNWKTNEVFLSYPWFSDRPQAGDMIALGSASDRYTYYVRLSNRPSVNRSMLTYLPFDFVKRVKTENIIPDPDKKEAEVDGNFVFGVMLVIMIIILLAISC